MMQLRRSRHLITAGAVLSVTGLAVLTGASAAGAQVRSSVQAAGGDCSKPVQTIAGVAFTGNESFQIGYFDAGTYPAVHEINAAGGIMCHKLQVITYDTKSDPADALTSFERVYALHQSVSWTGGDTLTTPTLLPVATRYKLPFVSASGASIYNTTSNPYFYRYSPPDAANGVAMSLYAQRKGYKRIATVFGTDAGSQGDLPGVLNGIKKTGAKLVSQINIVPDQPNYRTDVERLLSAKPQAIMTESDGNTAATFFSELRQLGKLVPIIGTSGVPSASYISPLSKAIGEANLKKDFTAVVIGVPNATTQAYKAYAADCRATKSQLQAPWQQWVGNVYTLNGYSEDIVIALAMDWAHSTVGADFNKFIPMVTQPGKNKVKVYNYAEGVAALKKGKAIEYIGGLGPMTLNKYHNTFPDQAVQTFTPNATATTVGVVTTAQMEKIGI